MLEYARDSGRDDGTAGMQNLASTARLDLIIDQNAKMAHAVGEHERMYSESAMRVFPYVIYHASVGSKQPRDEHMKYDGMIFEKTDPWLRTHTPPWEFGCNCKLEQITAKRAGKTPTMIRPPTPPEKVHVESKSGYTFDPETVFKEFDFELIKNDVLRKEAKAGVGKILDEKHPEKDNNIQTETKEEHIARRKEQIAKAKKNRVKREAKILGANLIKGKHSRQQDLLDVNPNFVYGNDGIWENNCQRDISAYVARRRGIDVESMPLPVPVEEQWKDPLSHFDGWTTAYKGGKIIDCSSSTGAASCKKIIKAMENMPDGAICGVQVLWSRMSGHIFIAEKINGNVVFMDPQPHGTAEQVNYTSWIFKGQQGNVHIL